MIYTKPQVLKKIRKWCNQFKSDADAARAAGISHGELSNALADRIAVPPKLRKAIGLDRISVYVDKVEPKYLDGFSNV